MWKLFSSLCLLSNICCSFCVNRNANISCWNFLSLSLSLSIHLSYIQVKIRVLRIEIRMKIFVVVIVRGALETFQWILKRFLMMRRTFKQFASFWMLNFMLHVIWRTTQNKTQSPYISLNTILHIVCVVQLFACQLLIFAQLFPSPKNPGVIFVVCFQFRKITTTQTKTSIVIDLFLFRKYEMKGEKDPEIVVLIHNIAERCCWVKDKTLHKLWLNINFHVVNSINFILRRRKSTNVYPIERFAKLNIQQLSNSSNQAEYVPHSFTHTHTLNVKAYR